MMRKTNSARSGTYSPNNSRHHMSQQRLANREESRLSEMVLGAQNVREVSAVGAAHRGNSAVPNILAVRRIDSE